MTLDPLLLEVLACPVDKAPLLWFADEEILYNPRLHKSYPVVDGVPVLLIEEGSDVTEVEHERLTAKAEREGVRGDRTSDRTRARIRTRVRTGVSPARRLDTLGMWDATTAAPEQALASLEAAGAVLDYAALPSPEEIRSVVIFGMGTSATAAELVVAHGTAHASIPVASVSGYAPPSFLGPHTLAFALSYGGDTEETCAIATAAAQRGAHVVIVSGGGALARMAAASDLTLFGIPADLPSARTALGPLAIPVLLTLSRMGIVPDVRSSLVGALTSLQQRRDLLVLPGGPAEEVARRIGRTIPLVYGSIGVTAVAARRWKTQFNENAKTPAFFAVQPELSHNEVAGWGQHGDVTRQVLSLITLRHSGEHPQVARRFDLVVEATDEVMADVIHIWTPGDDDLTRFFDLALFGDLVSLYLAAREGIDPGPAPTLSGVESALRR